MTCGTWRSYMAIKPVVRARFPAAFPPSGVPPVPLALDAHQALIDALQDQFTPWQVRTFLRLWATLPRYHQAVRAGGYRVNLDGTQASEITPEHRGHAADMLLLAGFAAADREAMAA